MASSGIYTYTYTRDQIINAALRKLLVLGEGVSANTNQLSTGAEALNLLILEMRALGMPLWSRKKVATTMVSGTSSYTISTPQALKVYQAYRIDPTNLVNIDMEVLADFDFNMLPGSSTGVPVNCTYQPLKDSGTLQVWPVPDSTMTVGTTVTLVYQAPFEVFTLGTETPDFPAEWYNVLVYNLALSLAPEYGLPTMDTGAIEKQADKHLNTVLGMGAEDSSVYISPRRDY